ncbi:hypothetical protein [Roseospira goensis]|uniref:Uncharacterized protein n=1 Tax=Roseospira goensis TaxID=391922 RepID=A0A7W6S2M7_9PROT|nr:hypothetical protein [Roseospira goensis]MBB4287052.1 hypothetical protein [Roseospira goensis]
MTDIKLPGSDKGQRPMEWLKEEVTLRLPRYVLVLAGVLALGLLLAAID